MIIPGLDGLRAVAFLVLFGLHVDYLQFGWMGVQLFFVLSGYLITGILLKMKENMPAGQYFFKFYARRFLRIFPLYYFFLLLIFLLATWMISIRYKAGVMQDAIAQIWHAVFYVYDFVSAHENFIPSRLMNHLWSLSVEEQFYIVWPLLVFFVPQHSLKKLFFTAIIAGPIFRVLIFFLHGSGWMDFLIDPAALAIYPLPFSHVDAFAFGAYISRYSIPHARKQLAYLAFITPAVGFLSQYAATASWQPVSALGYPVTLPNAYQFLWAYSLLNYWFAVLIYCVAREGMFVRILEWAPLKYLGKISYGLYVYHFPVIWFSGRIRDLGVTGAYAQPLTALIAFAGTLLIASLSYYLIEKPFLALKDRFAPYSRD